MNMYLHNKAVYMAVYTKKVVSSTLLVVTEDPPSINWIETLHKSL